MATGHDKIEKNIGLMIVLILAVVSIGGLVQIVPLFFQQTTTEAGGRPRRRTLRCGSPAGISMYGKAAMSAIRR